MIAWIIGLIIADLAMGVIIAAAIADFSSRIYKGGEFIAIIVFWPILAVTIGAIGLISMIAKAYLKCKEELEDDDEE